MTGEPASVVLGLISEVYDPYPLDHLNIQKLIGHQ